MMRNAERCIRETFAQNAGACTAVALQWRLTALCHVAEPSCGKEQSTIQTMAGLLLMPPGRACMQPGFAMRTLVLEAEMRVRDRRGVALGVGLRHDDEPRRVVSQLLPLSRRTTQRQRHATTGSGAQNEERDLGPKSQPARESLHVVLRRQVLVRVGKGPCHGCGNAQRAEQGPQQRN